MGRDGPRDGPMSQNQLRIIERMKGLMSALIRFTELCPNRKKSVGFQQITQAWKQINLKLLIIQRQVF